MTKPLTRASRQRELVEILREPPPAPTVPNWDIERASLPERTRTPGIRVQCILDAPREWRLRPTIDHEPFGDVVVIHRERDLDAAIESTVEVATKRIRESGSPVSDLVNVRKVPCRRA